MSVDSTMNERRRPESGAGLVAVSAYVRVAALPPGDLLGLRATASVELMRREPGDIAETTQDRQLLLDQLHAVVPHVDAPTRRAVLAVKRAVFAGREVPADHLALLPADLVPEVSAYSERHVRIIRQRAVDLAAESADLASITATLNDLLGRPGIRRGIAVTAPRVDRALEGKSAQRDLQDPSSSLSRTATAFLTRAALKPSPASTLATVGPVAGAALSREQQRTTRAYVRVAGAVAYRVLEACTLDEGFAELIDVEPAGLLHGGLLALPERLDIHGYLFRHDEAISPPDDAFWQKVQGIGRATPATHREALRELDPDADPWETFRRLVRRGLLRPVVPWYDHELRHDVLAMMCESAAVRMPSAPRSECWKEWARLLRTLDRDAAFLSVTPDRSLTAGSTEDTTRTAIRRVRRTGEELLIAIGSDRLGHKVSTSALLHETVADVTGAQTLDADPAVDEALGQYLRPHLWLSQAHQRLADLVAQRHGDGATATLAEVLALVGTGEEADHLLLRWSMLDLEEPHEPVPEMRTPPTLVAPNIAVHLQQAGNLVVLNSALSGAAAAAVRHQPIIPHGRPIPAVQRWLERLSPTGSWLALATAEEWTDLQGAPTLRQPRLQWPANPSLAMDHPGVGLDDLLVHHDPGTRTLALTDRGGTPLAVLPVATISPYMVAGPLRVLLTVVDPWVYRPRVLRPDTTHDVDGHVVGHCPRATQGRLVTTRETWWLPASSYPLRDESESLVAYLRRMDQWRRRHDLPEEVFVRGDVGPLELDPRRRKPQWVRWDSPHTLELAARLSRRVDRLVLGEALPATGAGSRVTETVRLLAWPNPHGGS